MKYSTSLINAVIKQRATVQKSPKGSNLEEAPLGGIVPVSSHSLYYFGGKGWLGVGARATCGTRHAYIHSCFIHAGTNFLCVCLNERIFGFKEDSLLNFKNRKILLSCGKNNS